MPVLALATAQAPDAGARLGARSTVALEPLDADDVRRIALLYAPDHVAGDVPVEALAASQRRRTAAASTSSRAGGRGGGRAPGGRGGRADRGRPQRAALEPKRSSPATSSTSRRRGSAQSSAPSDDGRRWCARSRAWPRSTSPTPRTSSAASGSSPSSSRGSSARRCSASSARREAASRPSCGPGCCPPLAGGVLPGSDEWPQVVIRPGEHPLRELARDGRAAGRPAARARRRPVRGDLHGLPGRAERAAFIAALVRAPGDAGDARCRRARDPGRLLRALRRRTRRCRLCSPPSRPRRADAARRAAPRDRAARRSAPACSVEPELVDALVARRRGRARRAAAAVDGAARALAAPRRAPPAPSRLRAQRGRARGGGAARRGGVRAPRPGSSRRVARACCCDSPATDVGGAVERRRVPLAELAGAGGDELERVLALLADRRLITISAGDRRGRPRGAAARMAAAARLDRGGRGGSASATPARRRRARLGRTRPRSGGRLSRRAAGRRAGVADRTRA